MSNNLFESFNKYFDHIYVITLKRSKDRHPLLKENLKGLNYKIFWGVDGSTVDIQQLISDKKYHPGLTRLLNAKFGKDYESLPGSKIGNSLSMNLIYEDIIKNKYETALILEDDVLFDKSKSDYFETAIGELPNDWDLLYLGYWSNTKPISMKNKAKKTIKLLIAGFLGKYSKKEIRNAHPRDFSNNLDKSGFHFGLHAYAVSFNGAKKILKYSDPITQHSDVLLAELCISEWINAYNLKSRIAFQNRKLDSTITGVTDKHQIPESVVKSNRLK